MRRDEAADPERQTQAVYRPRDAKRLGQGFVAYEPMPGADPLDAPSPNPARHRFCEPLPVAACFRGLRWALMDLNTIAVIERPRERRDLQAHADGDAWLAGGTWLFSEPQPRLRRLIDLDGFDWAPLHAEPGGLSIAATCKIVDLHAFAPPPAWRAARLIRQCCRAFLASFKIWNMATVGGNLCLSLPAGPMISLCAALEGVCTIWRPNGDERRLSVFDLVVGPSRNALEPGELLRHIDLPSEALKRRTAFRQVSLTKLGRSGALLIGAIAADGRFVLTVTAATRRPVRIAFDALPSESEMNARLHDEIPDALYYDDMHGRPDWRRHMTFAFAHEIRRELSGPDIA